MIEIAKKGMIQVKVRLKKALSLLLALVMSLGCMSLPAFATYPTTDTAAGFYQDSEDTSLYHITSLEGLKAFRDSVNSGDDYSEKTVQLDSEIDLSSVENWTPIGNGTASGNSYTGYAFKGVFNGDSHTISNLNVTTTTKNAAGLFGVVDGGTVQNLTLTDVSVLCDYTDKKSTGAAVGLLVGGGTVSGVTVESGSVSGQKSTGGVVGMMTVSGTISNCHNEGVTVNGNTNVGGVVGSAYYGQSGSVDMTIFHCTNSGSVEGKSCAGGIVGFSAADVDNCENTATTITGDGSSVGGIVGEQAMCGSVKNSSNSAAITNSGTNFGTGGIVGWIRYINDPTKDYPYQETVEVSGNTNSGSISGGTSAGGIVGHVYHYATVNNNVNTATSIASGNFAAGIVGSYQISESVCKYSGGTYLLTLSNNVSTTPLGSISGNCTNLYVYDNTSGANLTAENNTDTEDVTPAAPADFYEQDNVWHITSLAGLEEFRNSVNNGTSYDGATVQLDADITMDNVSWAPIGSSDNLFKGTFDGNNKTISNLYINDSTLDYAGLFGKTGYGSTIQNLTLASPSINARCFVGALAGDLWASTVNNVDVTGTIVLTGYHVIGGLAGQSSYTSITGCDVTGSDKTTSIITGNYDASVEDGDNVGGLIGMYGPSDPAAGTTDQASANCSVSNLTLKGWRKVGGLYGQSYNRESTYGASVNNIDIVCLADQTFASSKEETLGFGGMVGIFAPLSDDTKYRHADNSQLLGSVSNVTITCSNDAANAYAKMGIISGGQRGNTDFVDPTDTTFNVTVSGTNSTSSPKVSDNKTAIYSAYTAPVTYVAQISSTGYETLAEAITAASAGDTIELLADVTLSSKVTIIQSLTLDLNGKAITSEADDLFTVTSGTLTINDSAGGGSIYTNNWTVLGAYGGTIVVNAGKIGAAFANTAYRTGDGSITFNGGMINQAATYYTVGDDLTTYNGYGENEGYFIFAAPTVTAVTPSAIELAANGSANLNAATVSNETVTWSSSNTAVATVDQNGTVTAVAAGDAYIYATGTSGAYVYATVHVGSEKVVKNTTSNTEYASLQVAVNDAAAGNTIQLLNNYTLPTITTFPADKTLTLDLNGKTLTESTTGACLIQNYGTLTVTGNGTVTHESTSSNHAKGLIDNYGTLTIASGTFIDYGQGGGAALTNHDGGTLTVNSGVKIESFGTGSGNATIFSAGTLAVNDNVTLVNHSTDDIETSGYGVYCVNIDSGTATFGSADAENPLSVNGNRGAIGIQGGTLIINSGTFTGHIYRDLWITNDGSSTSVTINGGTFNGTKQSILAGIDDGRQDESDVALTINGGKFNKEVKSNTTGTENEWTFAIKGGYYKVQPAAALLATGYEVVELTSGTEYDAGYRYTVAKANVAQIDSTKYETLAAAIAAANETEGMQTIEILSDITLTGLQSITTDVTIALGTHSISRTSDYANSNTPVFYVQGAANLNITGTTGSISVTNSGPAPAIMNAGTGKVTVSGGVIEANSTGSYSIGIFNTSTGSVEVAGGAVNSGNYGIYNSTGSVTVTSGTINSTNGYGIYNSTGTVAISGGTITGNQYGIWSKGNVTMTNGTVTGGSWGFAMIGTATLNLEGGVVNSSGYGISTNGNAGEDCTINISGGAITGTELGVYQPSGKLNISGGTITGATGVYFKSTDITISGGTIIGTAEKSDYSYNGNGANATGDALVIDSCNYPNGIGTISISGGTFTSANGHAVGSYNSKDGKLQTGFITGGTFSSDPMLFAGGNLVKVDYASVKQTGEPATYKVGIVETTGVTAGDKNTTDDTVSYTMTTTVKEEVSKETLSTETNTAVTVAGTKVDQESGITVTDNDTKTDAVGAAALDNVDSTSMNSVVSNAIRSAGENAGSVKRIELVVVKGDTDTTTDTSTSKVTKVTYEVHPEAIAYTVENETSTKVGSYKISNDQLAESASFVIKLAVPDDIYEAAYAANNSSPKVKVTHISDDEDYADTEETLEIQGTQGNYYVEVTTSHFSEFSLEPDIQTTATTGNSVYACNLQLQGIIKVQYALNLTETIKTDANSYVVITMPNVGRSETIKVSDAANNAGYKVFGFSVAAQYMDEDTYVTLYNGAGEKVAFDNSNVADGEYAGSYLYGVYSYLNSNTVKNGSAYLQTLASSMKTYNQYSKYYFHPTEMAKPTLALPSITSESLNETYVKTTSGAIDGLTMYAANLQLKASTTVQIAYSGDISGVTFSYTLKDGDTTHKSGELVPVANGNYWVVAIPDIAAQYLDDVLTVTATKNTQEYKVTYSPFTYVSNMLSSSKAGLPETVRAFYGYNQAANEYFANK